MTDHLFSGYFSPDAPGEKRGEPVEFFKSLVPPVEMIGRSKKALNVPPSPKVAQEIFGIVPGVQVPFLSFAVPMTELTHRGFILPHGRKAVKPKRAGSVFFISAVR